MTETAYLNLDQSARRLGRSTSYLKTLICEGKLGGRLSGKEWLVEVRELDVLRKCFPDDSRDQCKSAVPARNVKKSRNMNGTERSGYRNSGASTHQKFDLARDIQAMDASVREVALQIGMHLAAVQGGKAIWNRIRQDRFGVEATRRAKLSWSTIGSLQRLQALKRRYIAARAAARYKRLLRSLPELHHTKAHTSTSASTSSRGLKEVKGIEGYGWGEAIKSKRYYWNEED